MEDIGTALGWDDEIDAVENEFEPIPDGDYTFEVTSVSRGQFNGSSKMCACPVANVDIRLVDSGRVLTNRLYLTTKSAWKLTQFFVCIGLRAVDAPKSEKLKMDWTGAIGRRGVCTIGSREYKGKTYNDVTEWKKPAAPAAPAAPQHVYGSAKPEPVSPAMQAMVDQTFRQAQQGGGF